MSDHFGKISIQQPASPHQPPGPPLKKPLPPSPRKQPKEKVRSRGKFLVWFLLFVLLFTLYSVAGFVGVPYYITTLLPKTIYDKTGFIFQAETVKFNPLTFIFSSENVKVLPADKAHHDLLKIKTIKGKLTPFPLLRNDLVIDSLSIEELEGHITREADGSYIFSSLFDSSHNNNAAEMMDFSDLPFQFSLNNIAFSNSKIIFSDLPSKKTHTIADIQLALPTFSNFPFQAGNYIQPHFSATIDGSPVELTGKASVGEGGNDKHTTDLSCDIHSLNLPLYFRYLPFDLPFDFAEGRADGKIGLTFTPNGKKGEKLAITFDLKINDIALSTHSNSIKITVPASNIAGTLHPVSKYIHLTTVSIRDPIFSSFGKNFSDNLHTIFGTDSKPASPKIQATAPPTIGIDLIIVDGGVLKLFNENESSKPHTAWSAIQFSLKNYTSAAHTKKGQNFGTFRLTGDQEGASSTFSWQGKLTGPKVFDGALSINNIQTSTLFKTFDVEPFITSKGLADLKGKFRFKLAGHSPSATAYRLTNTSISIQNFTLLDKKTSILSTPILTLSEFSISDGQTDFGTIAINNGTLKLTRGVLPNAFSLFSDKKYQINNVSFNGKATLLTGRKNGSKLSFQDVTLKAKTLNLAEKAKNNISIVAKSSNGGQLEAAGSVSLSPFKGVLKTQFKGLQSSSVFSWFSSSPFLANMGGFIGGKGNMTLPKFGFVGQLTLTKTSVTEEKKPVVSWETCILHDVNLSTNPFHLGIVKAELDSPKFSWEITAKDNSPMENLTHFLQKHFFFSSKVKQTKKNITISSFDVQEVLVKNGQIQVKEERMSPAWNGDITQLTGKITDFHSAKSSANSQFKLSVKLDDSPFSVEGQSNFFSNKKNGSFSFSLTDFPIADFHEQLSPLLDIDTSKGTFSVKKSSHWEDNQISSSGTVSLTGLVPESPTSESALPLALLTDQKNTFDLDFSLTLQEPTSKSTLFDEMIAHFHKLIVKSSVSPLLLATDGFTDLIDGEFVEFKPGEPVMSKNGSKTVERYSDLLAANPNIGLSISGYYDSKIDSDAMKMLLEKTESERVAKENKSRLEKWQAQKKAYEKISEQKKAQNIKEGKIAEQDIPPKFLQEFIPVQPEPVTVSEEMLEDLSDKRVGIVYLYFTDQLTIEPERVTIVDREHISPAPNAQSRNVSIKIKALKVP
jgi:hypothetical protein